MHPATAVRGAAGSVSAATFQNPVYEHSFPDPFVLRYAGRFYAYSTGSSEDGIFHILTSDDLVNWRDLGHAMPLPQAPAMHYWAPEVTYAEGKFYLYYSIGNEILMELRVAVADKPEGPFEDAGVKLTTQDCSRTMTVRGGCSTRPIFSSTRTLEQAPSSTECRVGQSSRASPVRLREQNSTGRFTIPSAKRKAGCAGTPSRGRR